MTETATSQSVPTAAGDFRRGLRDVLPVLAGAIPFGLTFAALAVERGLSFGQIMLMSAGVFAGGSQFVAVELWVMPLPFWAIVLAVLAVNFRHVLYSASMSRKVRHWPAAGRMFGYFFLVDPNYAFVELKGGKRLSGAYYAGLTVPLYVSWLAATACGAWFGAMMGDPRVYGIDFVATTYFTCLIVGFRKRPNAIPIVLTSAAAALLVHFTIGPPWHIVAGAFAGVVAAYVLAGNTSNRAAA